MRLRSLVSTLAAAAALSCGPAGQVPDVQTFILVDDEGTVITTEFSSVADCGDGGAGSVEITGTVITSGSVDSVEVRVSIDGAEPVLLTTIPPQAFEGDQEMKTAGYEGTLVVPDGVHELVVCFVQSGAGGRPEKQTCAEPGVVEAWCGADAGTPDAGGGAGRDGGWARDGGMGGGGCTHDAGTCCRDGGSGGWTRDAGWGGGYDGGTPRDGGSGGVCCRDGGSGGHDGGWTRDAGWSGGYDGGWVRDAGSGGGGCDGGWTRDAGSGAYDGGWMRDAGTGSGSDGGTCCRDGGMGGMRDAG